MDQWNETEYSEPQIYAQQIFNKSHRSSISEEQGAWSFQQASMATGTAGYPYAKE